MESCVKQRKRSNKTGCTRNAHEQQHLQSGKAIALKASLQAFYLTGT